MKFSRRQNFPLFFFDGVDKIFWLLLLSLKCLKCLTSYFALQIGMLNEYAYQLIPFGSSRRSSYFYGRPNCVSIDKSQVR